MGLPKIVHFVCAASGHKSAKCDRTEGLLTIEEGKWAFCGSGLKDGHRWVGIGPVDIETARRAHRVASAPADVLSSAKAHT